jgi:hypothetical protein
MLLLWYQTELQEAQQQPQVSVDPTAPAVMKLAVQLDAPVDPF